MHHSSLAAFLAGGSRALTSAPVAMIFAEDTVEVAGTIAHHHRLGFRTIMLFAPAELTLPELTALPPATQAVLHRIDHDTLHAQGLLRAVNQIIAAAPEGAWLYYCYNAEYLFFPFCQTRDVGEMLAFHAEERRAAMLTYVVDLYAGDLSRYPNAVAPEEAYLDRAGYYALARPDPDRDGAPRERQLDFYGGLRWRFEEHVPKARRKIDRIGLFRAAPGLTLRANHTLSDEECNTYACPWHHNLTAAICSFRTAKALKTNPGSTFDIDTFWWHNSARFEWNGQQLLDLGLMEPGQWF
ncbi:MAG: glycosyltransferase family 2 protein [Celeribacter sp.]|jgi:hypothetical protein